MAYRKNNNDWSGILIAFGVLYVLGKAIGDSHYFHDLNSIIFWCGYLLSLALFVGLISLIIIIFDKINKAKEKYRINNTYCEHGIKGGKLWNYVTYVKSKKKKNDRYMKVKNWSKKEKSH